MAKKIDNERTDPAVDVGKAAWRALGRLARAGGRAVRWHPWVTAALVIIPAIVVTSGVPAAGALVVTTGVAAVAWSQGDPASFDRIVAGRVRSSWRREVVYRRRWRELMFLAGLACRFDGTEVVPRLGRVRSTWAADIVAVRLTVAQEPIDWEARSGPIAQTLGALECRARATRPHWIDLELVRRRDLPIVGALAPPARPDLDRLPIGRRGDGRPWHLRLTATHVLIGGATGSGKASVIWSIIRSLASGIRSGWVQVWGADPKGGMELGHGTIDPTTGEPTCPLFTRFARTPDAIADLLGAAVEVMTARALALSGVARQHHPTVDAPAIVVIIDELAALATYGSEQLREKVRQHLGILLSQGRALGVHVVAAVQDPGQVHVSLRRAFPTRIALRTVEADQVDMILGKGAWAGGARCELIPETAPGCGWVLLDGDREPTWVRASWVDDTDIAAMATTYTPAATLPAAGHQEHNPTAEPDAAVELEDVA